MALSESSRDGTRQRSAALPSAAASTSPGRRRRPRAEPERLHCGPGSKLRPGFESRIGGGTQRIAVLANCFCFALGIAASLAGAAKCAQMGIGSSFAVGTITKSEAAGSC